MSCTTCKGITLDDPRFQELDAFIAQQRNTPGSLIAVLHKAQELFGFLPEEVQAHVAKGLQIPAAEVYGVVSFYNYFHTEPVGKFPISVCMGTACYVRGADRILSALQKELKVQPGGVSEDGLFSLEACRCIGACGLAPVITIAGEVYGKLSEHDVAKLIAQYREQAAEETKVKEPVAVGGDA